jgi:hypothetical protein
MSFDIIHGSNRRQTTAASSNAVRTSSQTSRPRRRPFGIALVAGPAALCVLVSTVALAAPAHAVRDTSAGRAAIATAQVQAPARGAVPDSVAGPIASARTALSRAITRLENGRYHLAIESLGNLRTYVGRANHAAKNQIGKPPTDPESDTPPGPPSVLAAARLDHTVVTTLLPQFDNMQRVRVVDALSATLLATIQRRDNLLNAVLALKPGPRGDYADSMADTLPWYTQEVQKLTDALTTFSLTDAARTTLETAQQRVSATKAKMDAAFGGGE